MRNLSIQRNNTSGVPGMRARVRQSRHGRPQKGIDVRYLDDSGDWRWTTLPLTLDGASRAIQLREAIPGVFVELAASTVLRKLKRQLAGGQ